MSPEERALPIEKQKEKGKVVCPQEEIDDPGPGKATVALSGAWTSHLAEV